MTIQKTFIFLMTVLTSPLIYGKNLSPSDIAERFEIKGECCLGFDASGRILLQDFTNTVSSYNPEATPPKRGEKSARLLTTNWFFKSFEDEVEISIHSQWEMFPDGHIRVLIQEFENPDNLPNEKKNKLSKPLKQDSFELVNFQAVNWKSVKSKDKALIVRFTPMLRSIQKVTDIRSLPLNGESVVIYDKRGRVWATETNFSGGTIVAISTHSGTVLFSLEPFQDGKEVGDAMSNKVTLNFDKDTSIYLTSATPFLPNNVRAKVYGRFLPAVKTHQSGFVWTNSSNSITEINEALKSIPSF